MMYCTSSTWALMLICLACVCSLFCCCTGTWSLDPLLFLLHTSAEAGYLQKPARGPAPGRVGQGRDEGDQDAGGLQPGWS